MISSKLAALLATFITASSANYFSLTDFVASDIRVPSASHHVSFHLTNPATSAQGGNSGTNCTISWTGTAAEAPKCYATCSGAKGYTPEVFLTRVVPEKYKSAGDFQIEILEFYHSRKLNSRNAAKVTWLEGQNDVFCSRGGQSDVCSVLGGGAWNVTYKTDHTSKKPKNICK